MPRPLDAVLRGRTPVRVLRALTRFPKREFTGRELAGEATADPSKTNVALARLEEHGLVESRAVGRARVWKLSETNLLAGAMSGLFSVERGLRDELVAACARLVRGVPGISAAILFGSVARGDDEPGSDVDLLVVVAREADRERVRRRLSRSWSLLRGTFGHPPSFLIYSRSEMRRKRSLPVVRNILREGVVLFGEGAMRTEPVDRGRARIYLAKAREFLAAMQRAREEQAWNAAGLAAIHAAISAADALTVRFLGSRSRGPTHEDAAQLVARLPLEGAEEASRQFVEIVRAKGIVEYEDRMFDGEESLATTRKAERFVRWARNALA